MGRKGAFVFEGNSARTSISSNFDDFLGQFFKWGPIKALLRHQNEIFSYELS